MQEGYVKLSSSDGHVFTLALHAAHKSGTLRNVLEHMDGECPVEPIPLPGVSWDALEWVHPVLHGFKPKTTTRLDVILGALMYLHVDANILRDATRILDISTFAEAYMTRGGWTYTKGMFLFELETWTFAQTMRVLTFARRGQTPRHGHVVRLFGECEQSREFLAKEYALRYDLESPVQLAQRLEHSFVLEKLPLVRIATLNACFLERMAGMVSRLTHGNVKIRAIESAKDIEDLVMSYMKKHGESSLSETAVLEFRVFFQVPMRKYNAQCWDIYMNR